MISDRIKEALQIRGMKAIDLAEKSGTSRGLISKYLNGVVEPKSVKLGQIAKALDVNEAWLLGYDVQMDRSLMDDQLIAKFNRLSRENQLLVINVIDSLQFLH